MNTTQLECFIAVAENLNYAKAAETVHLTQPAVTKKIQSLEEELEIRLFERDTRHVTLTMAGKQFYSNAKSILMQQKNALASIAQLKAEQKRSLVIGSHNVEIYQYLGQVIARIYEKTQDIRPDIVDAPFHALSISLETRSVDVVIGTYEVMYTAGIRNSAFRALMPSPFYCISAANHGNLPYALHLEDLEPRLLEQRFHLQQRISCYDLEQFYMSSREWQPIVSRFGKNTLMCDNMEAALCMVEAGVGFMFFPQPDPLVVAERFTYIPISDAHPLSYGYFYNRENQNPLMNLFRNEIENYFLNK